MIERVLNEIDAEIERLQQARTLLAGMGSAPARKTRTQADSKPAKTKKRTLSPEARERIRQAQIKRWAKSKRAAKG